jgi:uncharacterized alkaline shock family protein YloU
VVVELATGKANVSLELGVRYGAVLPETAEAVQEEIAAALTAMCELEIGRVDVSVEELV